MHKKFFSKKNFFDPKNSKKPIFKHFQRKIFDPKNLEKRDFWAKNRDNGSSFGEHASMGNAT